MVEARSRFRRFSSLAVIVPAAVAAVLLVLVLPRDDTTRHDGVPTPVMRGDHAAAVRLATESPTGNLPATPIGFTWRAEGDFDTYCLVVHDPALEIVLRREGLAGPRLFSQTACRSLRPRRTYLCR